MEVTAFLKKTGDVPIRKNLMRFDLEKTGQMRMDMSVHLNFW